MCTRVLWNNNKVAVLCGRSMDWATSTQPKLYVLPRGMKRDGAVLGGHVVVAENPARWTSKYGSIVTTVYDMGTADGMNEKGLAVHMLYLTATDFGPRDVSKQGLHAGLWAQLLLDRAATVEEALELQRAVNIVMVAAHGHTASVHLAIEDAKGDSAIIEFIGGKLVIHHGRQYAIMTNDPPYDEQLALLKKMDFSNANRNMPLPGNVNPTDRFQRSAYFLANLREPKSERQAVANVLSIVRNASVPFDAPYKEVGAVYNTEYRTVCDLTTKRYFFELADSPNVIWVELGKFDFKRGAPVKMLDPDNIKLSGDVSAKFKKTKALF